MVIVVVGISFTHCILQGLWLGSYLFTLPDTFHLDFGLL